MSAAPGRQGAQVRSSHGGPSSEGQTAARTNPPTVGPSPTRRLRQRVVRLRRVTFSVLLVVSWEVLARSGLFDATFMPSLQAILTRVVEMARDGVLAEATLASLGRLAAGFGLAAVLGILMGFLTTRLAFAEQMTVRLLSALLATPAVAWTPLFMLWFGLGNPATVALITFVATVPVALNTWSGIRHVDAVYYRVASSMDVTGIRRFVKVVLPAAFASVLAGLRLGFARSWHALVAGELLAGTTAGLGVVITRGRVFLDTSSMIAAVLMIAVLAYLTERLLFERVERLTLGRWGLTQSA